MAARYFAHSFYFIAVLCPRDAAHEDALALSRRLSGGLVTTDAVLLELADALSSPEDREATAEYVQALWRSPAVTVYGAGRGLIRRALALYASRTDKEWSLTDCISFVVMQDEGITEALTGDRHFEQAGFRTLFPPE
jgi:predicted nucleic acid-binding protein